MSILFRQAKAEDIEPMKRLWQCCFPEDEDAYIQRFFSTIPLNCALVACKGEPLAMCFLLPAELRAAGESYPVRYLYAGCTHPDHRGQGIYRDLLQYAADYVAELGEYAIYLHPASAELYGYYQRLGYQLGIGHWAYTQGKGLPCDYSPSTVEAYLSCREKRLPQNLPVWQLRPEYTCHFIDELLLDGWRPVVTDSCCGILSPTGDFMYDASSPTPIPGAGYAIDGEWQEQAVWLPVKEPDTLKRIMQNRAYTAFLGDI